MPLLKLQTTKTLSDDQCRELLERLSRVVAEGIGKSEQYVMVTIETAPMLMSGEPGDAAFADIRSIGGLDRAVNGELSQRICDLLNAMLGISPTRIYLNFTSLAATDWGWNGRTFG